MQLININKYFNILNIILLMFTYVLNILHVSGQEILSHQWLKPGKRYLKLSVAEDGLYQITQQEMAAFGLQSADMIGSHAEIWHMGKQIPLHTSTSQLFSENDYVLFYGKGHVLDMDTLLFRNWQKDMLHTQYSFITDTNTYYLTFDPGSPKIRINFQNVDINNPLYQPIPFYLHEEEISYNEHFFKVEENDVQYSNFEPNEGFASLPLRESTHKIPISQYHPDGGNPILEFRFGTSINSSRLEVKERGNILDTILSAPKTNTQVSYVLPPVTIENQIPITLRNLKENDNHRTSWIHIRYPRFLDADNAYSKEFKLTDNTSGNISLRFKNVGNPDGLAVLYHIDSATIFNTQRETDGSVKIAVPQHVVGASYVLADMEYGFKKISNATIFTPENLPAKETTYAIITHPTLMESAKTYALFRQSPEGGSYNTEIWDIHDIYDYFGYGIQRHPMAMKLFTVFLKQYRPQLEHIFIIGKGLDYSHLRTASSIDEHEGKNFFVPSFGVPASDNMLFSEDNFPDPAFSIGRLAAKSNEEVDDYLRKVKAYEQAKQMPQTIEDKGWMKRFMHLSGGGNIQEQTSIKNALGSMETRIENSRKGAEVFTFSKTSSESLQSAAIAEMNNLINTGVNMITFFGHSAPGTWDFNLENPSKFENTGRYFIVNSLGCYSGNIHQVTTGLSESFILAKDRGAVAFLASVGSAFIGQLGIFGLEQYQLMGNEAYGKSLGAINKQICQKFRDSKFNTYAFYQQLTLHGDPALSLYSPEGPDYVFNPSTARTIPSEISSSTKEIVFQYDIVNLGEGINDSIPLTFYHQLPDGSIADTLKVKIDAPAGTKSYSIKLNSQGLSSIGKNIIYGIIDQEKTIAEKPQPEGRNNNELLTANGKGFIYYVLDNTAFPIDPCPYAIVTDNDVVLSASTSNAFVEEGNYIFQIDTSRTFRSPARKTFVSTKTRGLIRWKPDVSWEKGVVYYWRISPDSIDPQIGYQWQESSFIYDPDIPKGWNHSHYFQFSDNNEPGSVYIDEERIFRFPVKERILNITNSIYKQGTTGYKVDLSNPSSSIRPWNFMPRGGIAVAIYDPSRATHIINTGGAYGSILTNDPGSQRCFGFLTDTRENRQKLMDFLENQLPDGHYVSIFTVLNDASNDLEIEAWLEDEIQTGKNIISVAEGLGAQKIRELEIKGTVPYTFMFRKGFYPITESIGQSIQDIIDDRMIIQGEASEGVLTTRVIGPASSWTSTQVKVNGAAIEDTLKIQITGIRKNKTEKILMAGVTSTAIDLTPISAEEFPWMRMELYFKDATKRTMPDIEYIRVFYEGTSDLAIDPVSGFSFYKDSIDRGDQLECVFNVTELGELIADSVKLNFTLLNLGNNTEEKIQTIVKKPSKGQTEEVTFLWDTKQLSGDYLLVAEINPEKVLLEKQYLNNIGKKIFTVLPDTINPLLDVYFDGRIIRNGEIVSANPRITMELRDRNLFLIPDAADLFTVQLQLPDGQVVDIPVDGPEMSFKPATTFRVPAVLTYMPSLVTGDYTLNVQAEDQSGNLSGKHVYSVQFRVIETQQISHVFAYPNPFSHAVQFIFTLTGSSPPSKANLQILSLQGKVIKTISQEELGPVVVGTNRTAYRWDGTDQYGSRVANGIYFYKIELYDALGNLIPVKTDTENDKYFQQGYGKIILLR